MMTERGYWEMCYEWVEMELGVGKMKGKDLFGVLRCVGRETILGSRIVLRYQVGKQTTECEGRGNAGYVSARNASMFLLPVV